SLERNREHLLSNVSHDLKNPLTTIKVRLALLARGSSLSTEQRHSLDVCDRNADRLMRLINDLLLISRLQTGKMQLSERPFGLKQLAEEVVSRMAPLADPAHVTLSLTKATEVFIRGDRDRIFDAIQHLIENAITHSPANSQVDIVIEAADGLLARLSVTDHGPGIEPELRERLFENFYRARTLDQSRSGGGLGLPIVARIVQHHGGRVEVHSQLGEGARFEMYLPLFAGAVTPTELPEAPKHGGILLVEDDADCREVLQQVLEEEGYRVMSVSGASDAMAILSHIRPAMVLLDLHLSQGDGKSVLHHIRRAPTLQDVVVYIVSGASDVASLTAGKGVDRIDGYFEKPLQLPKLLDTVASVVRPIHTDG
ncbi:MAG: hybrid sensor histidine kinase/response regulator, partial [Myxococcaceae bacterium]